MLPQLTERGDDPRHPSAFRTEHADWPDHAGEGGSHADLHRGSDVRDRALLWGPQFWSSPSLMRKAGAVGESADHSLWHVGKGPAYSEGVGVGFSSSEQDHAVQRPSDRSVAAQCAAQTQADSEVGGVNDGSGSRRRDA